MGFTALRTIGCQVFDDNPAKGVGHSITWKDLMMIWTCTTISPSMMITNDAYLYDAITHAVHYLKSPKRERFESDLP